MAEFVRRAEAVRVSAVVPGEWLFGFRNGARHSSFDRPFDAVEGLLWSRLGGEWTRLWKPVSRATLAPASR